MRFLKIFSVICLSFFFFTNIYGQSNKLGIEWQRAFFDNNGEIAKILQLNNGHFIFASTNYDLINYNSDIKIQELDAHGFLIKEKTFGGNSYDVFSSIIPTQDGGFLIGSNSQSDSSGDKTEDSRGEADIWLIKIDEHLNIQWDKTIGGNHVDVPISIDTTMGGGFIIGVSSESGISGEKSEPTYGGIDIWIIKLEANGAIEWENTIFGDGADLIRCIKHTIDGGYIIGSQSSSSNTLDKTENWLGEFNDFDYWIIKLNNLGNIEWQNTIGGGMSDQPYDMIVNNGGGYYILGKSNSNASFDKTENSINHSMDIWLVRINESGNVLWEKTIGGESDDYEPLFIIDKNRRKNELIIGCTSLSDTGYYKSEPSRGNEDYWLIKIDTLGNKIWDKTIGGGDYDGLTAIIRTNDHKILIGGYSVSQISGDKVVDTEGEWDFWILKLFEDPLTITGNIFYDKNNNCNLSTENLAIKNFSLRANSTDGDAFYTTTNAEGKYLLSVDDTGSYAFQLLPNESFNLYQPSACNNYNLHLTDTIDTLNFGMHPTKSCLFNTVNISTSSLFRRCMENTFYVQYANNGTISSPNTYIDVHLDDLLAFNSASIPSQDLGNNVYRFELGTVGLLESGQFTFNATPICDLTTNGQTLCVEAHIYPDSVCTLVDYRGANISASGECLGDSVRFILRNRGGNMAEPKVYIVIEGDVVRIREDYQLAANEELEVKIKAVNGATYRIIAEQPTDFPSELGDNFTTAVVEGCRPNPDDPFETGFVNQFSNYDGEPYSSVSCNTLIGSYDPNDKSAFPVGVGNQHFVEANTTIDYLIRFQNTGNDTAFKVVLVDTISNFLDINSIELGVSSHPYNFERIDSNVVQFVFSPIYLVDSFTNEPASNGFVKFKIRQKKDVPVGTTINNTADIYFDFNAPIRTNTTIHTIGKDFLQIQLTDIKNHTQQSVTIKAFPNPFKDKTFIYITSGNIEDAVLVLTNIQGQVIKTIPVNNGNQFEIHRNDLPVGVYFFSILSQNKILSSGKLIAE